MKEIKLNKLKEIIYFDKCDNGLEIYMWINEKVNNYFATLNVRYGSKDTSFKVKDKEYAVTDGIAHFLEHINFHESDGTTAEEFFNKYGTGSNAFTTFDFTSYEIFGSNNLYGDINHLLDFVQDKVIDEKTIENEKGIIIEEVRMGDNNPNKKMFFEINKALYKNNKARNEITGTVKDVKKISKQELELVYDSFYRPENMFIIITGNFNPYEMAALIKENQSKKKYNELKVKKIYDKEDTYVNEEFVELKGNIEISKLSLSYKMSRKKFKDYNDLELKKYLSIILNANFGPTSNLKEDLVEKELVYSLYASTIIDKDNVILSVSAETKYPDEVSKILEENMNKMTITEERLLRRIKCEIANIISGLDDIEFVNSYIQNDLVIYNKLNNDIYNILKTLNIEDATKILKHIDLNNSSLVIMNPNNKN